MVLDSVPMKEGEKLKSKGGGGLIIYIRRVLTDARRKSKNSARASCVAHNSVRVILNTWVLIFDENSESHTFSLSPHHSSVFFVQTLNSFFNDYLQIQLHCTVLG